MGLELVESGLKERGSPVQVGPLRAVRLRTCLEPW